MINNIEIIHTAIYKNIWELINIIAAEMRIGKNKNIAKLNITLTLSINTSKYSFVVCAKFSIASFDDNQIASNTFLFSSTIKYFE